MREEEIEKKMENIPTVELEKELAARRRKEQLTTDERDKIYEECKALLAQLPDVYSKNGWLNNNLNFDRQAWTNYKERLTTALDAKNHAIEKERQRRAGMTKQEREDEKHYMLFFDAEGYLGQFYEDVSSLLYIEDGAATWFRKPHHRSEACTRFEQLRQLVKELHSVIEDYEEDYRNSA